LKNDPIAVLEAINMLMHDTVRAQYPKVSMTDALGRLIDVRQQEKESLLDYVKRFKQLCDVVKTSQFGNKLLDQFVEHQADYPTTAIAQQTKKNDAFQKWLAYLLIR
jgi:hypothetical protein